ncbi:hypothetical protein DVH05_004550 [Phytophthora capsici]|nr:hypothetical protein DVH05_004550 [Phytophthora capsici]
MKTVESFKNRTLRNIEKLSQRELSVDESQCDVEAQLKKSVKNEIDFRAQGAKSSVPELFKLIVEQPRTRRKSIGRCELLVSEQKYHESDGNSNANSFAPRKKQTKKTLRTTAKYGSQDTALKSKVPHSKMVAAASSVAVSAVVGVFSEGLPPCGEHAEHV